ncbi:hypothetical protein AJ80_06999 [Polytolypa hystricis UAMH7299]|uniref:Gamma interferon inducible lysosomal thiol reductase n=1 Tax=Polytolypa hystricis (strain UAMH7299) TaxID=1447883 RepID=A0A2B7XT21_POLH7|nr:hypothetical protein AJ80_06999 [Polytolypa hystricis UAMH7299]
MEKYGLERDPSPPRFQRQDRRVSHFVRRCLVALCICLVIYVAFYRPHASSRSNSDPESIPETNDDGKDPVQQPLSATLDDVETSESSFDAATGHRVPLEAHIMSKCPDARYCLDELIVPAMVQIHDKVKFRLSFIGRASNSSSNVSCMHGPSECIGNMLLLCAANLPFPPETKNYTKTPTVRSLGFAHCLISNYQRIPERAFVEDCALEHGVDFRAINECASRQFDEVDEPSGGGDDGDESDPDKISGLALLRKSFMRNERLGIRKSCTVRVDKKIWCIRDGGVWKDCAQDGKGGEVPTLVEHIEQLWKERN